MTMITKEVFGKSESGAIAQDGTRNLTRMFQVWNDDSAALSLETALASTDLPSSTVGAEDTVEVGTVTLTYFGEKQFSRVDGHDDQWMISCVYSSSLNTPSTGTADSLSGGVKAVTKGFYRIGAGSAPNNWDDPNTNNIGGTAIDVGGIKTSITFPQATLSIKKYKNDQPALGNFANLVGMRNTDNFQNATIGSVLFTGLRFSQDGSSGLWLYEYEFAFDPYTYHAEQVAKTDVHGKVATTTYDSGGNWLTKASHVFWVQPFPDGTDLQAIVDL